MKKYEGLFIFDVDENGINSALDKVSAEIAAQGGKVENIKKMEVNTLWHLDKVVMPWIAEHEYGGGLVMNAFRICLVGAARGPHIWEITNILGKAETLARVRAALTRI